MLNDFQHLKLTSYSRAMLETEIDSWHEWYLPLDVSRMKTILTLGAGSGETVQFYLNHGASKVIAVESDDERFSFLQENFKNDSHVVPIHALLTHIQCDIEGFEDGMIIATHSPGEFKVLGKHGNYEWHYRLEEKYICATCHAKVGIFEKEGVSVELYPGALKLSLCAACAAKI